MDKKKSIRLDNGSEIKIVPMDDGDTIRGLSIWGLHPDLIILDDMEYLRDREQLNKVFLDDLQNRMLSGLGVPQHIIESTPLDYGELMRLKVFSPFGPILPPLDVHVTMNKKEKE